MTHGPRASKKNVASIVFRKLVVFRNKKSSFSKNECAVRATPSKNAVFQAPVQINRYHFQYGQQHLKYEQMHEFDLTIKNGVFVFKKVLTPQLAPAAGVNVFRQSFAALRDNSHELKFCN